MLDAHARLLQRLPDAHLVIAGDGPCQSELEAQIERLGIGSSAHLLGDRADVDAILQSADAGALSSDFEGKPLFALECMAAGTPMVTTAVGGLPELITHEETGLLVPPRDPEALAAALERVLTDTGLARRLASAAASRSDEYSLDSVVQKFVRALLRPGGDGGRAMNLPAALKRLVVDAEQPLYPGVEAHVFGEVDAACSHPAQAVLARCAQLHRDSVRHRLGRRLAQPQRRQVDAEVAVSWNVGGDHGRAARHRLERRKTKPFSLSRGEEDVGGGIEDAGVGHLRENSDQAAYAKSPGLGLGLPSGADGERHGSPAAGRELRHGLEQQGSALELPVPQEAGENDLLAGNAQLRPGARTLLLAGKRKPVNVDGVRKQHRSSPGGTTRKDVLVTSRTNTQMRVDCTSHDAIADHVADRGVRPSAERPVPVPYDDHRISLPRAAGKAGSDAGGEVPAGEMGVEDCGCSVFANERPDASHPGVAGRQRNCSDRHARVSRGPVPEPVFRLSRERRLEGPPPRFDSAANRLERRYKRARVRSREVGQVYQANLAGSSCPHRARVYWRSFRYGRAG